MQEDAQGPIRNGRHILQGDRPEHQKELFQDTGRANLSYTIPELHTEPHDAYRQSHEVQAALAVILQESTLYNDRKDHQRHLQQERFQRCKCYEIRC